MNKNDNIINLPFWETIKRSFLYFFVNFRTSLQIISFWTILLAFEILCGTPALCSLKSDGCQQNPLQLASLLLLALSSVCICVSYCRAVILKEEYKFFSFRFGLRELRFIGYGILIMLINVVPSLLLVVILSALLGMLSAPYAFTILFSLIIMITVFVYASRFYLILPAVAVDNSSVRLKKSFQITVGNANKIFWGMMLISLPTAILVLVFSSFYHFVSSNFADGNSLFVNTIFVTFLLLLNFLSSCLKASYYAHIYQYFIYFDSKRVDEADVKAISDE